MSVRLSLLALLAQGACYGYQLRTELDWRTGGEGPVNVGQIYNTLDRLERDKLVRKTGADNYYEITEAGHAAVAEWFSTPSAGTELPAKLALAITLPAVDVGAIIRIQRGMPITQQPETTPSTSADLAAAVMAFSVAAVGAAESTLLDKAERLLALEIPRTPLSAELPKRGRPAKSTS